MKKVFIILLLLFIGNICFAELQEYNITADAFFGKYRINISQVNKNSSDENLNLYDDSLFRVYGFMSKKALNVFKKLKSETIIAKVEFNFNNNRKFFAEGVLYNVDEAILLNLTTSNREEIFKKIYQEKVVAVKIILSAPFLKNDETVVIEENFDFREAYKKLTGDSKDVYDHVLKNLKEK